MPGCEKCWEDAYQPWNADHQAEIYRRLIEQRNDNPCTPKQQAGQFWDEEKQCDNRTKEITHREDE